MQSVRPTRRLVGAVIPSVSRRGQPVAQSARPVRRSAVTRDLSADLSARSVRRSVDTVVLSVSWRGRPVGQSARYVHRSAGAVGPPASRCGQSVGHLARSVCRRHNGCDREQPSPSADSILTYFPSAQMSLPRALLIPYHAY